jgi:hypothetical protein
VFGELRLYLFARIHEIGLYRFELLITRFAHANNGGRLGLQNPEISWGHQNNLSLIQALFNALYPYGNQLTHHRETNFRDADNTRVASPPQKKPHFP